MALNPIRKEDIIDDLNIVNGLDSVLLKLQDLQKNIDGLSSVFQGAASEMRQKGALTGSNAEDIKTLATEVGTLSNAVKSLRDFNDLNKASIDALSQSLKLQTEAEKNKNAELKNVTEQEKANLLVQQQLTEKAKQQNIITREQIALEKSQAQAKKASAKMTEEQSKAVDDYIRSVKNSIATNSNQLQSLNEQKMSYNQLAATYSQVKEEVNKLTIEYRRNTDVGKNLDAQAKKIADAMNIAQQATGKYGLNVGNYRSAFDGLGWSVNQVARELPSLANSANQFFLAISNNIPMVIDEWQRYNIKMKETNAAIDAGIVKGSKMASAWQHAFASIISWQTAIIAALTILSQYGGQIIEWIKNAINGVTVLQNITSKVAVGIEIAQKIFDKTSETTIELKLLSDRLHKVKQGTEEWRTGVNRVNELTHSNLNYTTATIGEVDKVTNAYIKQAEQLAKNQAIIGIMAENEKSQFNRTTAQDLIKTKNYDYGAWMRLIGGGENKDVKKLLEKLQTVDNQLKSIPQQLQTPFAVSDPRLNGQLQHQLSAAQKERDNLITKLNNTVNNNNAILDTSSVATQYKTTNPINTTTNTTQQASAKYKFEDLTEWLNKYKEAYAETNREVAILNEQGNFANDVDEAKKKYAALLENMDNYGKQQGYSQEKIEEEKKKITEQYNKLEIYMQQDELRKLAEINAKFDEKERKELLKTEKEKMEVIVKSSKNQTKALIKVRTANDEAYNNKTILANIDNYKKSIDELNKSDIKTDEGIQERKEKIDKLNKSIGDMISKISLLKELDSKSIGETLLVTIYDKKGLTANSGAYEQIVKNYLVNVKKLYNDKEFDDIWQNMEIEGIEDMFEKSLSKTMQGIETFYNQTTSYISDIISAWSELAQAKVDAAKEGVDAAQEAYDKEKSLLDAGYANQLESAEKKLQAQKAAQKKAEKEAEKAKIAQEAIDTAQQVSSLITATANIYASSTKAGGLLGIGLANALIATMWASFIASKVMAYSLVKYGDGTAEMIEGGSHASGHDVSLAYDNQGRQRRVEGGEMFAVSNKRSVSKYGKNKLYDIVKDINKGTYQEQTAFIAARNSEIGGLNIAMNDVNLNKIEGSLDRIERQGNYNRYVDANGDIVETYGNLTRTIKLS